MTRKIDVSLISANNITSNHILLVQNSQVIYAGITAVISPGESITINANGRINSSFGTSNVYSNVSLIGYATNTNVALKANITDLTTSNVVELSNLYFTNARSYSNTLSALRAGNGILFSSSTGNITLSTTGVVATSYGNATIVPVVTVDAFGRISNISNVNISATGGASVTISNTAPSAVVSGVFWLDSDYLDMYVSYDNTWVMINGTSIGTGSTPETLSPFLLSGM